ncbi:hypothetical protein GIB67_025123 [Kingdonia uniflora]|uniref:Clathrin heavy chain n=1 Tax=Kingdonia uniflora TaxID=39325 RepID=A0A7J7N7Q8_9MAGN|nr:hypothetical protein GIB67_025123 [Kingdonia uniflora]
MAHGQVAAAIKVIIAPNLPHELIELLEKIVFQNPTFSGRFDLETLLLATAFKVDVSRVMDYINSIKRVVEFAFLVEEDAVWSLLANAQHEAGMVDDAIELFMRLKPA